MPLISDWGTGEPRAIRLLSQIRTLKPDILLHLGDVYYSGTQDEMQRRFLDVIDGVFGKERPRVFSLCGNHDMYSGGRGYYGLVKQLGQASSYFAVQNRDWRFVAMDTGFNDRDPTTFGAGATLLDLDEAEWVKQTVNGAGGRKVVLFSHHPPFSAYDPIGGKAVNTLFLDQIRPCLPNVSAWFWGHEHRLGVYDSYEEVARGRCLGHGAIPVFADGRGELIQFPEVPVYQQNGRPLTMGTAGGFYKTGFAVMTLDGKDASVSYYREGESAPFWNESF